MSGIYDVQQVCEHGHQITGCYNLAPEDRQEFCKQCGAKTIIACPNCDEKIQGDALGETLRGFDLNGAPMEPIESSLVPKYCPACGNAYPWTQNKIVTAIQILMEFGDLEDREKETIEQDVENVAKDIPEAELSAMRIKRIWERGKAVGYEAIMEFVSRTAAKILKGP